METVVLVMMVMLCFNYILKQTFRKVYSVAFSSVVCAMFVGLTWRYAIEQSGMQISACLADSSLMLDLAVVLTLEVSLQMAFCILSADVLTSGRMGSRVIWLYRFLRWFPGILIYPVLFSLLVFVILSLPGASYSLVAWSLAVVVFALILLGSYVLRWLLPEKEIRLEALFLLNAFVAILGVVATVNGRTAVAGSGSVNWFAFGGVLLLLALGLLVGMVVYRVKLKRSFGHFLMSSERH